MRHHHTGSRPHVQGSAQPLRVRHSARTLTDSGGLVLVRKLFDRLGLAGWIDTRTGKKKGFFRPSLIVEAWVVLLLYGASVMDDLPLLERRGVRQIFGRVRGPDPTTFGRWPWRVAEPMVPLVRAGDRRRLGYRLGTPRLNNAIGSSRPCRDAAASVGRRRMPTTRPDA